MPDNTRTVTERRVTPAAFAAWLHAQGQEPSVHVLAWFKHKGVAWPPVAAAPAAAVLSLVPAQAPAAAAPAPVGKVPQKAMHPKWTGERLAQKRAELKATNPQNRDTTQQLAELSGLKAREITRREKDAREDAAQGGKAAKRTTRKAA